MQNIVRAIEVFITHQGEGPDCGQRMLLVRYKRCNRNCPWCDTQVKMRISNEFEIPIKELQQTIADNNLGLMITGGEPTFGLNYGYTINLLNKIDTHLVNIETNGIDLEKLILETKKKYVKFILSPKIFSDEDQVFYFNLINNIKEDPRVYLKIVYEGREYNDKLLDFLKSISFNNSHIYLMPEGKDREELIANSPIVFDAAEKYKVNFTSREHIIYNFL